MSAHEILISKIITVVGVYGLFFFATWLILVQIPKDGHK